MPGLCLRCGKTYSIVLVALVAACATIATAPCTPPFSFIGEPYPLCVHPSPFSVKYGDSLEIFCSVDPTTDGSLGRSWRDLYFSSNNTVLNSTKVNKTTIRLYLPHPDPGKYQLSCDLNVGQIKPKKMLISGVVGTEPQTVTDFKCVSENWRNMTCKWTPPKSFAETEYKLFSFDGIPCPKKLENGCFYGGSDYRQAPELLKFTLTGTNQFGKMWQNFTVNNFNSIIPAPPVNLSRVSKTFNSCIINWTIPHPLQRVPPGLSVIIEIKSEWDAELGLTEWQTLNTTSFKIKANGISFVTYKIKHLKYAGTSYDVRVYLKVPTSNHKSLPASLTFTTDAAIPLVSPETTPGSFDLSLSNNSYSLVIYWRRVDNYLRRGKHFEYNVTCLQDGISECMENPIQISKDFSYANFIFSGDYTYLFKIRSQNEVGVSRQFSKIVVPKFESVPLPHRPVKLTYGEGEYKLSWEVPLVRTLDIASYTVFSCGSVSESPLPCKGVMNWTTAPGHILERNLTVDDKRLFYLFGVSATTTDGSSSAISWASCDVSRQSGDSTVMRLDNHYLTSTTTELVWELGCEESAASRGYFLTYCAVKNTEGIAANNTGCVDEEKNVTVMNTNVKKLNLTELLPYTTYDVSIALINVNGNNGRRTVRRFSTLEGIPDPPTELQAVRVTNTSVTLEWVPPYRMNGVFLRYLLYPKPYEISTVNASGLYTVEKLERLTPYEFKLQACTSPNRCSKFSNVVNVTTKMAFPDPIRQITVNVFNDSSANVTWTAPAYLAPSSSFEIEVSSDYGSKTFNSTITNVIIPIHDLCKDGGIPVILKIRAINYDIADNGSAVTYIAPFSDPSPVQCNPRKQIDWNLYALLLSLLAIVAMLVGFCLSRVAKKGYICSDEIRQLKVILPLGLDPELQSFAHPTNQKTADASATQMLLVNTVVDEYGSGKKPSWGGESFDLDTQPSDPQEIPCNGREQGEDATVNPTSITDSRYLANKSDHYVVLDSIHKNVNSRVPTPGYVPLVNLVSDASSKGSSVDSKVKLPSGYVPTLAQPSLPKPTEHLSLDDLNDNGRPHQLQLPATLQKYSESSFCSLPALPLSPIYLPKPLPSPPDNIHPPEPADCSDLSDIDLEDLDIVVDIPMRKSDYVPHNVLGNFKS